MDSHQIHMMQVNIKSKRIEITFSLLSVSYNEAQRFEYAECGTSKLRAIKPLRNLLIDIFFKFKHHPALRIFFVVRRQISSIYYYVKIKFVGTSLKDFETLLFCLCPRFFKDLFVK